MDERIQSAILEYIVNAAASLAAVRQAVEAATDAATDDAADTALALMHDAYVWIDKARDRANGNLD